MAELNLESLNWGGRTTPYTQTTQNMGWNMPSFGGGSGGQTSDAYTGQAFANWNANGGAQSVMDSGTAVGASGEGGINFLGPDGWGNLALGGIQTGLGAYMGFKQLGMAKDQLDFQKKAFNKNFETQKKRTNTQLRDRQKRRHYEKPGYYQSPGEYMNKNGVK